MKYLFLFLCIYFKGAEAQTRFYLTQLASPFTVATNASWNVSTALNGLLINYKEGAAQVQLNSNPTGIAAPAKTEIVQYVSGPLIAQVINGTFTGQIRCARTTGAGATAYGFVFIRKISASGTVTDISNATTNPNALPATGTLTNRTFTSISLSNVTINSGDRLCLEIGADYVTGTITTIAGQIFVSTNATTDLPVDNSNPSGSSPWFEFSQNLILQTSANIF
jgi:hypothetical protein